MQYTKGVVSMLAVLSLFSASCLFATYQVNKEAKSIQYGQLSMLTKVQ